MNASQSWKTTETPKSKEMLWHKNSNLLGLLKSNEPYVELVPTGVASPLAGNERPGSRPIK